MRPRGGLGYERAAGTQGPAKDLDKILTTLN